MAGNKDIFLAPSGCSSPHLLKQMLDKIQVHSNNATTEVLSFAGAAPSTPTIQHFMLQLFRRHGLHKNEREMVLSKDDQLIAVQLCLANINKQVLGDFNTEASKVIETNRHLTAHKLQYSSDEGESASVSPTQSADFEEFLVEYSKFQKTNNVTDWTEVYSRLILEIPNNEELRKDIAEKQFFLLGTPACDVEKKMLLTLAKDKNLHTVRAEVPLDQSFTEASPDFCPDVIIQTSSLEEATNPAHCETSTAKANSITELYVECVFLDYLHLLVNSRNELSLARVINLPVRGLGHTAFTHLKHEAHQKQMSMFQTAVSYIMRLRLGGKSYAPDPNSRLAPYVKGLSEFVDLMHKLQTILEEDPDSRSAVRRTLIILKNAILKSADNVIRPSSVTAVAEKLQNETNNVINNMEKTLQNSPPKSASVGGSQVGRKALRVLQCLLDDRCAQPSVSRSVDVLSDAFSSLGTPVRFPCVMSKFRSPLEYSPTMEQKKALADRVKQKEKAKFKVTGMPRYQATHDWAVPTHHIGLDKSDNDNPVIEDFVPSKTLVQPGGSLNHNQEKSAWSRPLARRVLESMADQENVSCCLPANAKDSTLPPIHSKQNRKSNKRSISEVEGNAVLSQTSKAKKPKKNPPKTNKKVAPLQKGQKQLTAFFRV